MTDPRSNSTYGRSSRPASMRGSLAFRFPGRGLRPFSRPPWRSERLFFDGNAFFGSLLSSIRRARTSIDLETYIFATDPLGKRVLSALEQAVKRGIRVRVLVDYVGSPGFEQDHGPRLKRTGIPFRIYRSWDYLWERASRSRLGGFLGPWRGVWRAWVSANHRDHRKLCLIDGREAWLGSFNVTTDHLRKGNGPNWRDTGIRLEGLRTPLFQWAFLSAWQDRHSPGKRIHYRRKISRALRKQGPSPFLHLNSGRFLRDSFRKELLSRLENARGRIWITSAYFVPTGRMFRTLLHAAKKGLDVRLLLPGDSDVPFVKAASRTFYKRLLEAGARIFEYQAGVLHAKTLLADRWALVGSSNFDHRSFLHDLEINVTPRLPGSLRALETRFRKDLRVSREIFARDLAASTWWERAGSWFFFQFRRWL